MLAYQAPSKMNAFAGQVSSMDHRPAITSGNHGNGPDLSAFSVHTNRYGPNQTHLIRPHQRVNDMWGREVQRSFWNEAGDLALQVADPQPAAHSLKPVAAPQDVARIVDAHQTAADKLSAGQQKPPVNRMKRNSFNIEDMKRIMSQSQARVQASGRRSRGLEVAELTRSAPKIRRVHTTWMKPRLLAESDRKSVNVFDATANGPWVTSQSVNSGDFNLITRGLGGHSASMFGTR